MRRCLAGDQDAWAAVVDRYADFVYGIARRSGLDAGLAGDVVQEVFLALCRSLGRLRRRTRLMGWLSQTARRAAWRARRRQRAARRRERAAARREAQDGLLPAGELAHLEEVQTVRQAYGAIGERCRRLLDLLFVDPERPAYAEIAERLGMPVGSIGPTRQRCLEALRKALEDLGYEGPVGPPPTEEDDR